eukprot:1951563-Pyramimonas_sp.AAC.1
MASRRRYPHKNDDHDHEQRHIGKQLSPQSVVYVYSSTLCIAFVCRAGVVSYTSIRLYPHKAGKRVNEISVGWRVEVLAWCRQSSFNQQYTEQLYYD